MNKLNKIYNKKLNFKLFFHWTIYDLHDIQSVHKRSTFSYRTVV